MAGTISKPAPLLGEHTDAVLTTLLRLSADEIAALRESGALGQMPPDKNTGVDKGNV